MADRAWKASEREIARRLRGRRVGNQGRATCDVLTETMAVEVKSRNQVIPRLISDALLQAEMNRPENRVPVAVLHDVDGKHDYDLVCLWMIDFQRLLRLEGAE